MQLEQRRVNKLYLNLSDASQQRLIVARFEDAFNTASLPGLPPNRLVLIRRLELGRLADSCSNIQISNSIDAAVRRLAATAVCLDTRPVSDANVVWFQDELQAYLAVSLLLAGDKPVDRWYWRCLFPDLPLEQSSNCLVEILLRSARVAPSGPMLICRQLLRHGCVNALLARLEPRHAVQLLQLAGYTPSLSLRRQDGQDQTNTRPPAPAWIAALDHWISSWGENDVRPIWLMHCAVQDSNPAQLVKQDLAALQSAIRQFIAQPEPVRGRTTVRPAVRIRFDGDDGAADLEPAPEHPGSDDGKANAHPASKSASTGADEREPARSVPTPKPEAVEEFEGKGPWTFSAPESVASGQVEQDEFHNDSIPIYSKLNATDFAGLSFVVPLLEHLGITSILTSHQHAIEQNLPAFLLWSVAERFEIDESDPAVAFIPEPPSPDPESGFEFAAPASWLKTLRPAKRARLFRHRHNGAIRHVLTNCRNRVVLAIWYEQPPAAVTDLLAGAGEPIATGGEAIPDLQLVGNSFHLMMGICLRTYCNLSLRRLVHRSGKIATTNTHVDSVFAGDTVDLGLRKTGFDTNPGWVPWLGKVIQFHYEYDDEHYF